MAVGNVQAGKQRCVCVCVSLPALSMCVSSDVALVAVMVADSQFKSRTGGRAKGRGRKGRVLKV